MSFLNLKVISVQLIIFEKQCNFGMISKYISCCSKFQIENGIILLPITINAIVGSKFAFSIIKNFGYQANCKFNLCI